MTKNFFEVNNVDFNVGNKTKVKNVSFAIENQGDVICLLGPSGIGKTTILRTIAGLEKLKKGSIILNGKTLSSENINLEPEERNVSLAFQDNSLFPHYTVEKNILTEPIKTQYGYHLIEVLERTGEKVLSRHILIRTETTDLDKKKTYDIINNIKNDINNFEDFSNAALNFSDDKTSNTNKGFLGMIDLDYYQVPELKQEIKNIKTKTVSNPISTDFGYHLIWVDEIKEGGPPNLESNWLELEEMALNKKKSDWYNEWIAKIKSQFYIKRNPLTYPQING